MMSMSSVWKSWDEIADIFSFNFWKNRIDLFIIILKQNLFTIFLIDIPSSDDTLNS